jgi:hypothetical protein
MADIVHTSRIRIIQDIPPVRRAFIESFAEPIYFGVHSSIASFYGVTPDVEYPATLDHLIAAVGG